MHLDMHFWINSLADFSIKILLFYSKMNIGKHSKKTVSKKTQQKMCVLVIFYIIDFLSSW